MLIGSEKWLTKEFRSSEDTFKRETDLKSAAQDIFLGSFIHFRRTHVFYVNVQRRLLLWGPDPREPLRSQVFTGLSSI